jgi:hypothetical protein
MTRLATNQLLLDTHPAQRVYRDCTILHHCPGKRVFWKVYRDGQFVATYDRLKDAKRRVERDVR